MNDGKEKLIIGQDVMVNNISPEVMRELGKIIADECNVKEVIVNGAVVYSEAEDRDKGLWPNA